MIILLLFIISLGLLSASLNYGCLSSQTKCQVINGLCSRTNASEIESIDIVYKDELQNHISDPELRFSKNITIKCNYSLSSTQKLMFKLFDDTSTLVRHLPMMLEQGQLHHIKINSDHLSNDLSYNDMGNSLFVFPNWKYEISVTDPMKNNIKTIAKGTITKISEVASSTFKPFTKHDTVALKREKTAECCHQNVEVLTYFHESGKYANSIFNDLILA